MLDWSIGRRGARSAVEFAGVLADIEIDAVSHGKQVDICTVSVARALAYLDFRYKGKDWRSISPALAAWFKRFAER
jgi:hypothetical protein